MRKGPNLGQKTHPVGFRLGIVKDWQARWFGSRSLDYAAQVKEDLSVRNLIRTQFVDAGISRVEIERTAQELTVTVHTARPGIVIGRGGQRVDELRKMMESTTGGKQGPALGRTADDCGA